MTPDELYRLPPEEFTAARNAAAKAAKAGGDADRAKQLTALRRPSVSAWLVNLLAAEQPELVEQLLALGPALAEAQAQGQGDELRSLGAQRRELVDAVTQQAAALADRPVTPAVRAEVASTLETALADPDAAEAVRSGRLVRALSYAGFGGVDLGGAVASTTPPRPGRSKDAGDDRPARVAAAEAAALDAAGRLDDAVRECERLERERRQVEQRAAQAHQELEQVRQALAPAEREAAQARTAQQAAARAADEAVQAVRAAQQGEERARAELDRLRRG